tara:strand:+ start:40964 stop:41860 length:897 start_codon:yes stop_codon:yes gene_type:complete
MKALIFVLVAVLSTAACSSLHKSQLTKQYDTDADLAAVKLPKGQLAIVIDGNSPDPDDIGATPVMLRLLQSADAADRLVHISHSCDLDPFRNKAKYQIDAENESRRQQVLQGSINKGLDLFGPFNSVTQLYNCRTQQGAATQDLVNAINKASKDAPLWIIEAGEPDLIGYALAKADSEQRKYVKVVSHHPANDNSGDYFTWQQILDFGVEEYQIGDQNVGLQTPIEAWDWAKNSDQAGLSFIWDMLSYAEKDGIVPFQAGKFDCSDAGMVYWWLTGAGQGGVKTATPNELKPLLLQKH